jgi:3,4-dihydroxy 2-butanone 4-phosphate synthase / GTP cyclohydrolase II
VTTPLTAVRGARADDESAGIVAALDTLAAGRPVVFVDEANGCGHLVQAAEHASVEFMALAATYGTGAIRVAATADRLDELGIPMLGSGPHYAPVDLRVDAGGGVHRHRAATVRAFAACDTRPGELAAPGHVFSSATGECRTLDAACAHRAMIDAISLAGLEPVAAHAQLVDEQGFVADRLASARLARRLGLTMISMRDILIRREQQDGAVQRIVEATIPTPEGRLNTIGYVGRRSGDEYVAFVVGQVSDGVRVEVHRRCMLSDVFGGVACGCGEQLRAALAEMRHAGSGVVIYHGDPAEVMCASDQTVKPEAGWATTVEVSAIVRDLGARRVFISANERLSWRDLTALGLEVVELSGVDWYGTKPAKRVAGL